MAAPIRVPRAAVPDWFSATRDAIVGELDQARDDARRRTNVIRQRRADITVAEQRLEHADIACEPFDRAVTAARHVLDTATRDRDAAAERAARARFGAGRDARRALSAAADIVGSARAALADAEQLAEPARSERRTASARLEGLRREDRDNHVIEDYLRDPARAAGLERKLAVLDRWRAWADGAPMNAGQIGELHEQLERGLRHDWLRDDPSAQLADILKAWATDHSVALRAPRPTIGGPEQYLGPEL